jgi:CRP-like cAMP-binding protein
MTLDSDLRCLQRLPMLKEIEPKKLKLIALVAERVEFAAGEYLYRTGDPPDSVFIILSGKLAIVSDEEGGGEKVLWSLEGATMLGQVGILSGHVRGVSVRAETPAFALKLSPDDFNMMVHDVPAFAVAVMRELALQLEATALDRANRFRPRTGVA